jgi:hypothetical protein
MNTYAKRGGGRVAQMVVALKFRTSVRQRGSSRVYV